MQHHTSASSVTSSITPLSSDEIDQVSGAGLLSFFGSALHTVNVVANETLNTAVISSVGQTFNLLGPVGVAIHQAADTGGYLISKGVEAVATAVGGTQDPVPYHYNTEWA
ncbi:MAG: hypothetical protein JWQ88_1156 [Rhodoferax sp.]|nr:hypothetical protein [Rhodoferax sp.]